MMEEYDFNIWSNNKGELTLTAYQTGIDRYGEIATDTEKYQSITFKAPEDIKEIEYLLNDLYLNQYPLTDYDEWTGASNLYYPEAPERIKEFLDSLPDYEPRRIDG